MGRHLKGLWLIAAGIALTTPAAVNASTTWTVTPVADLEEVPCGCHSELVAEALYWTPGNADFNFAEVGFVNPAALFQSVAVTENLFSHVVDPDYDWGFRVGYRGMRNCWFANTSFAWWESDSSKTVTRGPGDNAMTVPVLAFAAGQSIDFRRARGNTLNTYLEGNLQLGYRGCNTCRGHWEFFGMFDAFCWRQRARVKADGETTFPQGTVPITAEFTQDFTLQGFGAGFGLRIRGNLPCGFSIGGEAQQFATVQQFRGKFESNSLAASATAAGVNFYEQLAFPTLFGTRTCFNLAFKARTDLQYNTCWKCLTVCGHLGYEVQVFKIGFVGGPILGLSLGY